MPPLISRLTARLRLFPVTNHHSVFTFYLLVYGIESGYVLWAYRVILWYIVFSDLLVVILRIILQSKSLKLLKSIGRLAKRLRRPHTTASIETFLPDILPSRLNLSDELIGCIGIFRVEVNPRGLIWTLALFYCLVAFAVRFRAVVLGYVDY